MQFKIDLDEVEVDEVLTLESGEADLRFMKKFLARFAHDDQGQPIPFEDALAAVGHMKLSQMKKSIEELGEAVKNGAVNPPSGGS